MVLKLTVTDEFWPLPWNRESPLSLFNVDISVGLGPLSLGHRLERLSPDSKPADRLVET